MSRDSGRTWGREKSYYARDCLPPLLNPAAWGGPGDEDDNTDIEDGDGGGGNPSPGHR